MICLNLSVKVWEVPYKRSLSQILSRALFMLNFIFSIKGRSWFWIPGSVMLLPWLYGGGLLFIWFPDWWSLPMITRILFLAIRKKRKICTKLIKLAIMGKRRIKQWVWKEKKN